MGRECLLLANNGLSDHVAGTSALPPLADIGTREYTSYLDGAPTTWRVVSWKHTKIWSKFDQIPAKRPQLFPSILQDRKSVV